MVPPVAHRTAREKAGGQLRVAHRAAAEQLDQGSAIGRTALDRQDDTRVGLDVNDVIPRTAVFVGVLEGAPPGRERQPAVTAGEVADVSHG